MNKTTLFQILRLTTMVAAVAGIIYALEFMPGGIAVWFWVALLGIGFVGTLWSFRIVQRRVAGERKRLAARSKSGKKRRR